MPLATATLLRTIVGLALGAAGVPARAADLAPVAPASDFDLPAGSLKLETVLHYAGSHRQEIAAARAQFRAARERPQIVSALEDPMVMPSIDHAPYMMKGEQADLSLMIEQRFPFSHVRKHRREAAEADARRLEAQSLRITQDVLLDAARAFLMLRERRETVRVLGEQISLASQLVAAANARYGAANGSQPEVLRAEIEVARLTGTLRAVQAEAQAAEAMFNASLGRSASAPVPSLESSTFDAGPAGWDEIRSLTLRARPELAAGRAEISRAEAEISVMKSMYRPMGVVRTGPAYTMADKGGWMLGVGISLPIWRGRLSAGVREAQAMADMARADYGAMETMIEGEAASARGQLVAARERMLALRDDVLPRARNAISPSLTAYAAGTLAMAGVIDSAEALWSVQGELVSAEYEFGLAWARLYRAQGDYSWRSPP